MVGVCFQCGGEEGGRRRRGRREHGVRRPLGAEAEWRARVRAVRMPWRHARGPVCAPPGTARAVRRRGVLPADRLAQPLPTAVGHATRRDAAALRLAEGRPLHLPAALRGRGRAPPSRPRPASAAVRAPRAAAAFDADGMLRFRARLLAAPPRAPAAFWAAGFSFCAARSCARCRTTCPFLFRGDGDGAARGRAASTYSHPTSTSSTTAGSAATAPLWADSHGPPLKQASQRRVRRLLTGAPPPPRTLATPPRPPPRPPPRRHHRPSPRRSSSGWPHAPRPPPAQTRRCGASASNARSQYEEFAGVDLAARRLSPRAERGGLASEASRYDQYASLEVAAREEPNERRSRRPGAWRRVARTALVTLARWVAGCGFRCSCRLRGLRVSAFYSPF